MKIWICRSIPNTTEIDIVGGYIGSYQEKFNPAIHLNLVGNALEADVILVPHDARYFAKNTNYLTYLRSLSETKPLLISDRGDFPAKIKMKNTTFLRVGTEPGEKVFNTVIIPYNITSISYLPFRNYEINPKLNFTGLVPKFSLGRTAKSFIKAPLYPCLTNASIVRRLTIKQIKKTSLDNKIVIRDTYGGIANLVSNSEDKREEFLNGMAESDFILCPRGDSNGSVRFYESLSAGRIPLIPDTRIKFPHSENFNLEDVIFKFSLFNSRIETDLIEFWRDLNLEKYQKIQEDLRTLYNTQYKFDVFLKNLLNSGIENFNKYISYSF
jgi:hypothetical protein